MFERRTIAERIELAKTKMEKVLDHFLYVVELHANNSFDTGLPNPVFLLSKCLQRVSAQYAPDRNCSAVRNVG